MGPACHSSLWTRHQVPPTLVVRVLGRLWNWNKQKLRNNCFKLTNMLNDSGNWQINALCHWDHTRISELIARLINEICYHTLPEAQCLTKVWQMLPINIERSATSIRLSLLGLVFGESVELERWLCTIEPHAKTQCSQHAPAAWSLDIWSFRCYAIKLSYFFHCFSKKKSQTDNPPAKHRQNPAKMRVLPLT